MRYFFAFLVKHSFFLFFLLLEAVALIMIINHNRYHSSVIINATNDFTSSLTSFTHQVSDYFSLKKQNIRLAEENAQLKTSHPAAFLFTDTLFYYQDSIYKYTSARVIDNSLYRRANYIIIDKGKKHGIDKDMGIISDAGIAGIIVGASENFSIGMSLLHKDSKISALVKRNNQLGNIIWNTTNPLYGTLEDIPSHITLKPPDTIITSGYSQVFPKGLMIGVVEEFYAQGQNNFNAAKIRFATDFGRLSHVYVIENMKQDELKNLESIMNDE